METDPHTASSLYMVCIGYLTRYHYSFRVWELVWKFNARQQAQSLRLFSQSTAKEVQGNLH